VERRKIRRVIVPAERASSLGKIEDFIYFFFLRKQKTSKKK
jgi:hypothetical protein